MLDVMFELPSREDIVECVITKETITENAQKFTSHMTLKPTK